jgi:tetratricopeptide (TPR) repeat protein
MRRKLFSNNHPRVARSLNNLGHVLQARGNLKEAEGCYREALSIATKTLGKDHVEKAIYQRNLASVLVATGKAVEAEPYVREAASIFRAKRPTYWRTADADSVLGACLVAEGKFQEAESLLLKSYPLLKADPGDGAKHATEARQRIVDLYTAWGKPEKAAEYRAKA